MHIEINEFSWTANSDYLLVATGTPEGGTIDILEFQSSNSTLVMVDNVIAHTSNCYCLKVDSSYQYMAVGSADFLISIWDLQQGICCINTITAFDSPIRCISFSPNGTYLAAAAESSQLLLCNTNTGQVITSIDCKANINAIAWHPVGNMIAVAIDDKIVTHSDDADSRYSNRDRKLCFLKLLQFS